MGNVRGHTRGPVPIAGVPDGTVLYDGVCVFCSAWFHFIVARDPTARFRFTAVQDPYGHWLARRLGLDPENPDANAVVLDGHAHFGADAALQIMRRLPRWSPVARMMGLVPRPIRNWVYNRIARNRYRLFGRTETCMIPAPALRRHILSDLPPRD